MDLGNQQGNRIYLFLVYSIMVGIPLLLISQCMSSSKEAPVTASVATGPVTPTESTEPVQRTGSTMLEQAIFDAFPPTPPKTKAERRKAANAADFVGLAINAAGHLCARPIEAQEAAPGQYGVGCILRRDGYGRANYLIDSRTGSVDEI